MVIIENETRNFTPPENTVDEDDHDGWAPVRPRRSSMPAAMQAESTHEDDEVIEDPEQDASS